MSHHQLEESPERIIKKSKCYLEKCWIFTVEYPLFEQIELLHRQTENVWTLFLNSFGKSLNSKRVVCIINFIVYASSNFLHPTLHCLCLSSSIWFWGIGTFWAQKIAQEKIEKIHKNFELSQVFMYSVVAKILGYS